MTIDLIDFVVKVGGVGALMALIMFLSYRHLVQQIRTDRQHAEESLTGLLKEYNERCREQVEATIGHTQVMSELHTWLKDRNGK